MLSLYIYIYMYIGVCVYVYVYIFPLMLLLFAYFREVPYNENQARGRLIKISPPLFYFIFLCFPLSTKRMHIFI